MTHRKSAFTLLELLTVIAILGLLMSILLPSLHSARKSAKANTCLSHIKLLGTAFSVYLNENDDRFPPARIESPVPGSEAIYINAHRRAAPRWQWFVDTSDLSLIDTRPFNHAITRTGYFHDDTLGRASARKMSHDQLTCPSLDDPDMALDIRDGAYGYNYQYLGNTRTDDMPTRWDNFAVRLHSIRSTAATIVAADSRGVGPKHGTHSYTLDPPRLAVEQRADRFGPERKDGDRFPDYGEEPTGPNAKLYLYSPMEPRHKGMGNVLFVDAHAEPKSLIDLGYDFEQTLNVPKNTPKPIGDPRNETYTASNKLWTGNGNDALAEDHRPAPPTPP